MLPFYDQCLGQLEKHNNNPPKQRLKKSRNVRENQLASARKDKTQNWQNVNKVNSAGKIYAKT